METREHQTEASIAIQVLPNAACGVSGEETIRIVDVVIGYIKGTGLKYFVGPFETTIEGPLDRLWDIAKECQHICIREGARSVAAYVKSFYSPEGVWTIEKKTAKYHTAI
jgi:uncharacterized protein YqgV (UPF0045/DUF77 family)